MSEQKLKKRRRVSASLFPNLDGLLKFYTVAEGKPSRFPEPIWYTQDTLPLYHI
jgi:hypothetical protein